MIVLIIYRVFLADYIKYERFVSLIVLSVCEVRSKVLVIT